MEPLRPGIDFTLLLAGALLFAGLVYACLPTRVIPLDDDFGYLRSVVATLQHGRPWTDDWLEPWAASLATLGALLYRVFGNFYAATYGLLTALAAVSFAACAALLRERTGSTSIALLLATVTLTFPTLFWKTVQFTSMAVYLPCLFGALLAFERRQWAWFLGAWMVAMAARQCALAWIGLPFGTVAGKFGLDHSRRFAAEIWRPALTAAMGVIAFLGLKLGMNQTHAQAVITGHLLEQIRMENVARNAAVGAGVFLLMAGLGAACLRLRCPAPHTDSDQRSPAVLATLALGALVVCAMDLRSLVQWEHLGLSGTIGLVYVKALVAAGMLGWGFRGTTLSPGHTACAILAIGLVCLRPAIWDYYFIDAAAFGYFGVRSVGPVRSPSHPALGK